MLSINSEKKIAITGATGFIGRHLVKRLNNVQGIKLSLFDRKRHSLLDLESLKNFVADKEVIFHLAGLTSGRASRILEIDTLGVSNLLEAIRIYGKEDAKIIFPSSFSVYKPHLEKELMEEDFPTEPRNIMGVSKLLAEQLIGFYSRKWNITALILRFSSVYGPGCPPFQQSLVSTIAKLIKDKKEVEIWGDGLQEKDLIYVEDAVSAFLKAMNYKPESNSETFNICSGKAISVNKLVVKLERLMEAKAERKYILDKASEAREYWIGNNQKARDFLKWHPETTLDKGLAALAKSF